MRCGRTTRPDGAPRQALVSRLRRALPEITVVARPAGYQLVLDRDQVDVPGCRPGLTCRRGGAGAPQTDR